jgi:hypothetical protein
MSFAPNLSYILLRIGQQVALIIEPRIFEVDVGLFIHEKPALKTVEPMF